ncbi:class I SAM-dependent methyltransferase [Desulfotomaculum sp. 1211_IL3151]|uniref:class I SAM-dependent methyltransferase n=1 Tax=Desulfotomaculum sp. 1211_IL3151 TaxID=3084055 RepID=UPI002FDA77F7
MINWFAVARIGHYFLAEILGPGDTALDGTMGNGYDTLFLAQSVGCQGKVYAFDIQAQAIQRTKERLASHGVLDQRIELIQDGHQNIGKYIKQPIKAAIYNLGYLPGGNHEIITETETTLRAMNETLNLLVSRGRIVIVVYPGHPGGQQEQEAIEQLVSTLDTQKFKVLKLTLFNSPPSAPGVIFIEKAGEKSEN